MVQKASLEYGAVHLVILHILFFPCSHILPMSVFKCSVVWWSAAFCFWPVVVSVCCRVCVSPFCCVLYFVANNCQQCFVLPWATIPVWLPGLPIFAFLSLPSYFCLPIFAFLFCLPTLPLYFARLTQDPSFITLLLPPHHCIAGSDHPHHVTTPPTSNSKHEMLQRLFGRARDLQPCYLAVKSSPTPTILIMCKRLSCRTRSRPWLRTGGMGRGLWSTKPSWLGSSISK